MDLLDVLDAADALAIFIRLPPSDQEDFKRWIGMARDDESHWRRINAVVQAMTEGPFQPFEPREATDRSRG